MDMGTDMCMEMCTDMCVGHACGHVYGHVCGTCVWDMCMDMCVGHAYGTCVSDMCIDHVNRDLLRSMINIHPSSSIIRPTCGIDMCMDSVSLNTVPFARLWPTAAMEGYVPAYGLERWLPMTSDGL